MSIHMRRLIGYVADTIRRDMDNIAWVLPMAFLIGFYLYLIFSTVDRIVETREHVAGRYSGLDAISYIDEE